MTTIEQHAKAAGVFALVKEQMTEAVTLKRPTTTKDSAGYSDMTFATYATPDALVKLEGGSERVAAGRPESKQAGVVKIPYRNDIERDDQVTVRGESYDITGIRDIHGAGEITELTISLTK